MAEGRFLDALHRALMEEMGADQAVIILGEDVAVGGPFGVTAGLLEEFGERRVINTPISEDTIMGVAVGAATAGKRPVVEVMFMDFLTLAMSQLVNHAAKVRYMSGGQLHAPLVVRVQLGAVGGWGAHHSQSLEAWFQHVPGLKVVAPSTAVDAHGLLKASIRDEDPVLFLEHRGLYFRRDTLLEAIDAVVPLGEARVLREGDDVTIVSYSRMVHEALAAAEDLRTRGLQAEVVDLRTLVPMDTGTVVGSVQKTNHVVIAHEAATPGGVGAELAARIQEAAFDWLDAPVYRVGAPFSPVPAGSSLEAAYGPTRAEILRGVERVLGLSRGTLHDTEDERRAAHEKQ